MGSVADAGCAIIYIDEAVYPVSIENKARASIEKFWPLKIGNKSTFNISTGVGTAKVSMSVERTKDVQFAGRSRSTYVVVQRVDLPPFQLSGALRTCQLSFRRTIWYDPSSGLVVRDRMRWLGSGTPDTGWDYELVEAKIPGRPLLANAAMGTDTASPAPRTGSAPGSAEQLSRTAAVVLPPAAYKPLPVGTRLDYGSWECTVEESNGLEVRCGNRRHSVSTYGVFVALHDEPVEQMMGSVAASTCGNHGTTSIPTNPSIGEGARAKVDAFWPLKVGNRSVFDISAGGGTAKVTMSVDRAEDVHLAGERRSTYVVVQTVELPPCRNSWLTNNVSAKYRRTVWYDPTSGLVVRDRMRWQNGQSVGLGWEHDLVKARFPKRPMVAQAAPPAVQSSRRALAASSSPRRPSQVAAKPLRTRSKPEPRRDPMAGIHFGGYRALVIGNNGYRDLPGLNTASNDAREVAAVLRADYGFEVDLLVDATRSDMFKALARLRGELTPDDNLLIYYAGHGFLDELAQLGYWLPVDAERDIQTNWISNGDVTAMLRAIRAKHIMVVADSCYAGTLVRSSGARLANQEARAAWIKRMNRKRSRTALVSGGLEPVADSGGGTGQNNSVFAKAFLTALRDNTGVMDGNSLFNAIKRPVVLDADQTPQYSDIRRSGHEGGDFLFVKRR